MVDVIKKHESYIFKYSGILGGIDKNIDCQPVNAMNYYGRSQ